jgi:hypothetical protein
MSIKFDPKDLNEQYNLDKESIARNWFFVGHALSRIKRSNPSTKIFGQVIGQSEFADIQNHDRSYSIWMYQNWRDVLNWIEAETGTPPADPFHQLSRMNASHPAHIKRKVLKWLEVSSACSKN